MNDSGLDARYHYPPEIFQLLVDTIPRLCRSKRDVLTFFRGAGVRSVEISGIEARLADDSESISNFHIVRSVLSESNDAGDKALRKRREVLKRVVEFEDFSTCWPDDRLKAQGLVSQIRRVVDVKDSFIRMKQERDTEVRRRREANRNEVETLRHRREVLDIIRKDLNRLFAMRNSQERGRLLEGVLNRLFSAAGILVREAFSRVGEQEEGVVEQIDGVIEIDGDIYLVEMKWRNRPVGVEDVSRHLVRVFTRSASRGLFISYSDYTGPAVETCRESLSKVVVALCTLQEFVLLLEREGSVEGFLRENIRGAIVDKQPFKTVSS